MREAHGSLRGLWTRQGSKLVGAGAVNPAEQNGLVALSSEGSTTIVAGDEDNSGTVAVWLFATPSAPLELVSFCGTANQLNAELQWNTATEINNVGFDIERRPSSSQTWTKIGSVTGAGTSNFPHTYSYTDNIGIAGTYSYRLKQIDRDGAFKYSQEVQVTIEVPKVLALSLNYPEPFNPSTTIQFTVPIDGRATLTACDAIGQEAATLFIDEAAAGVVFQVQFNGSNLASGIYLSQLEFGGKMQVMKVMLLR